MREWQPILQELSREPFPLSLKDRPLLTTHFIYEMDEIRLLFWKKVFPRFNEDFGDIIPEQLAFGTDELAVYKEYDERFLILSGSTNRIYATGLRSKEGNTGVSLLYSTNQIYNKETIGIDTPYQLTIHTYTDRDTFPLAMEQRTKGFHETRYYLGKNGTSAKDITIPANAIDNRPVIYEVRGFKHVLSDLTPRDFGLISTALDYFKTSLEIRAI